MALGEVEKMKKIFTLTLIALLLVGVAGSISPALGQTTTDPMMRVAWEVANQTRQFEHSGDRS